MTATRVRARRRRRARRRMRHQQRSRGGKSKGEHMVGGRTASLSLMYRQIGLQSRRLRDVQKQQ
jgi:hypothetical protein